MEAPTVGEPGMFRKSTIALALLLLTLSFRLYALGLGEIDMQSVLNQPMSADISLISDAGTDLSRVKVKLASREAHERLGLSRAKILSNFSFDVVVDGRGKPVIHVSSFDPVREPYLEFLLEMVWENGRMVREYTVLVDPPVTMRATPVAPVAPTVRTPGPGPAITEPVRQSRPVQAPKPAASAFTPAPVQKKSAELYGPVRREETLWSISDRLRPDRDISVKQMMIALQQANPHAFENNNINNLKAGATLKVPDRDAILAISKRQARIEAERQYKEWREERSVAKTAVKKPAEDLPVKETTVVAETEAQLKLTPPEGDAVAGSASNSVAGETGLEASGAGDVRQQLALASEEIEAGRAQSKELQSRVLELEAQIEKMQRLLELRSDELAGMQNQAGGQAAEPVAGEEEQPAESVSDNEIVAATEAGDVAEEAEAEDTTVAADVDSPATEPRGLVNRLMDNPVLAGLGVLVAMLLGGFLWGSIRKQSSQGMFNDEPTLDKHLADVSGDTPESAGPTLNISDPGMFGEAATDSMGVSTSDAASDPVTEADVYLAYGRIQQAEDVLQAALQVDPENVAVQAKLLWVYHAAGNVAAFDSAASEYRQSVPEDDSQWKRIAAMGYELSPENELYRSAKVGAGEEDNVVEFNMNLSGLDDMSPRATMTADANTGETGALPESLEFSLDDADEDAAEGLLASADEVATKLDLARAYLDMEDPEGARSILQEVIEEGNEEQKSEAESLISNIA